MLKFIAFAVEVINGIRIVLSPFIAGIILGSLAVLGIEGIWGKILGVLLGCTGLILGIYWAVVIAKRKGTTNFMSKVDASPDLDKQEKQS